jgi:hypothetical protein
VSGNSLLASLFVGSVGFGVFAYGKRQRRGPHLVAGVVMMGYPYLVSSVPWMLAIAVGIGGLLYFATYLGL